MKRIHLAMTVHTVALAGFGALAVFAAHNQSEARKCEARAVASIHAGQPFYAEAWRWEEQRAQHGHGCRDNITATDAGTTSPPRASSLRTSRSGVAPAQLMRPRQS